MTTNWLLLLLLVAGGLVAAPRQSCAQVAATGLAGLGSDVVAERRAVADAVVSLRTPGLDEAEAIARQLSDLRRNADWRVANLMNDLRLRRASGTPQGPRSANASRSNDGDIIELMVRENPDPVVEHALEEVCLMRALTRIGSTPAVRQLVLIASDLGGAFRPDVSRELKLLDERATAALIEARGDPSVEIRTWAKDSLEALGKRTPGDSVQTTNDQVLVDVLRAYAAIQDLDALPVIVSFVNSERTHVRAAAREATLSFGRLALGRLRATFASLTGERLPDNLEVDDVAHKLFDAYDHERLRAVYAQLDQGLAKQRTGDIAGAIADFDNVLARQPMLDRSAEIAPAYVAYAVGIESTDRALAVGYLRKALRLEGSSRIPSGPGQQVAGEVSDPTPVQSEILYLDGEELIARGIVDANPFERALALDPANARARTRINRIRANSASRRVREGRFAVAVEIGGFLLIALGLFGRRRDRRVRAVRSMK